MQVREALAHKVSRERVGTELHGMFTGAAGLCMHTLLCHHASRVELLTAASFHNRGHTGAGPDPVRAVRDIQRLRLFPVVFAPPTSLAAALGEGYGAPCTRVMAAAAAALTAWDAEVWDPALQLCTMAVPGGSWRSE